MSAPFGQTFQSVRKNSRPVSGFKLAEHDRITVDGKVYRFSRNVGDAVELVPAGGDGFAEQFDMGTLSRLGAMGRVKHEVGFHLPPDLKPAFGVQNVGVQISSLSKAQKERFYAKYAQVMAVLQLIEAGEIRNNTADIENARSRIEELAKPFFAGAASEQQMIEHDMKNRQDRRAEKSVRKPRGGKPVASITLFSSDRLRKLVAEYRNIGLSALVDNLAASGNRTSLYEPEVRGLLMRLVQENYLRIGGRTKKQTVQDVRRGFQKENEKRKADGKTALRIPGRDAIVATIAKLDPLKVLIAWYGRETAIKKLRPTTKGVQVSRPGERVEMDEWRIDLLSIIHSAELQLVLGEEFVAALELDKSKARWWLVVAIDCRTKVILGMKLTRNPTTSAARECLRMVLSDKGQWADRVGALSPWHHSLVPEMLVTDNGPAFKANLFSSTCVDLGMSLLRTIGGMPGMRGTVERLFQTAALDLMPRLHGRTFSNPAERGDYPAEDRACLDATDVAFALVRWVVDIYHNSPHAGLGGLTPLQQWEDDMASGNYPLRALPDTESKRLAFGHRETRRVTQSGIVVMGIRYHSRELAAWFLLPGNKEVDVRWDPEDLGAINAFIEGAWREVPAVHERYSGMNLHVWLQARRALRARSASRKKWDEETVFKAIDDIEALAAHKSVIFGLVDKPISEKELKHIETSLFSSFEVTGGSPLADLDTEPGREVIPRAPDVDEVPTRPKKSKPASNAPQKTTPSERKKAPQTNGNKNNGSSPSASTAGNKWLPVKKVQDK